MGKIMRTSKSSSQPLTSEVISTLRLRGAALFAASL
jgi:hypothetical protein